MAEGGFRLDGLGEGAEGTGEIPGERHGAGFGAGGGSRADDRGGDGLLHGFAAAGAGVGGGGGGAVRRPDVGRRAPDVSERGDLEGVGLRGE